MTLVPGRASFASDCTGFCAPLMHHRRPELSIPVTIGEGRECSEHPQIRLPAHRHAPKVGADRARPRAAAKSCSPAVLQPCSERGIHDEVVARTAIFGAAVARVFADAAPSVQAAEVTPLLQQQEQRDPEHSGARNPLVTAGLDDKSVTPISWARKADLHYSGRWTPLMSRPAGTPKCRPASNG